MNVEMQHRLDQQTELSLQRLLHSGKSKLTEQSIPLGVPDAVAKVHGRKKRVKGGFRLETGPEAAERIALLRERIPHKQSTHKRTHSIMVDRTPEKLHSTSTPIPAQSPTDLELPLSTAPAAAGRKSGRANQANNSEWRQVLIPKQRGGKK